MKRILILAMLSITVGVFAQKAKVTSTYNYLKYGELDNAKEAIDEATTNETTSGWYKTWMYRAQTYSQLARSKDEKYAALKDGALEEAIAAYKKVITIEDKKNDVSKMKQEYAQLIGVAYNMGLEGNDEKDYAKAYKYWVLTEGINTDLNAVDTPLVYNIALVASFANMTDESIAYLDKCIGYGYKGASAYSSKARIQLENDDEPGALETLGKGREQYPTDQGLITQELNIYLTTGRNDEALANLNAAIENDPTNYLFYFARGSIYDNKSELDNAVADYKKSIELKPDHFDSYFNLGASYFNEGAELLNKAGLIPTNKPDEYDAAKKAAVDVLKQSVPYLEKAHELMPNDMPTMSSLKTIYLRINETAKAVEMNKKIEAASAGTAE